MFSMGWICLDLIKPLKCSSSSQVSSASLHTVITPYPGPPLVSRALHNAVHPEHELYFIHPFIYPFIHSFIQQVPLNHVYSIESTVTDILI